MKALSLWQPWASLMAIGAKHNETRSWPLAYRGDLVIHAAKIKDGDSLSLCGQEPFVSALTRAGINSFTELPFGAIVGVVHVDDCVKSLGRNHEPGNPAILDNRLQVVWPEVDFGLYDYGRWITLTSNPRRFRQPIPWRGAQGVFNVPDDVILAALGDADQVVAMTGGQ